MGLQFLKVNKLCAGGFEPGAWRQLGVKKWDTVFAGLVFVEFYWNMLWFEQDMMLFVVSLLSNTLTPGFPLHTRLTTTIFYCLAALFEEVGFVRPQGHDDFIFLSNFLGSSNTAEEIISSLEAVLTVLISHKSDTSQVLFILVYKASCLCVCQT